MIYKCEECEKEYFEVQSNSTYQKVFCSKRCQKIYEYYLEEGILFLRGEKDAYKTDREKLKEKEKR